MEKRGQNKKSQSQIITTVLIILLVLVSVIIVWNVVKPMVEESAEKINTNVFSVQLEIEEVKVWLTDNIEVKVRRDAGEGEIDSLKFVFEKADGSAEIIERKKDDGYDMPEQLETKTYEFEYSEINGKVEKVGIAPVIGANLGIEVKEPEYKIRKDDYGIRIPDMPPDPQTSCGLVSWWKFDGDLTDNVGENDGSCVNCPAFIDGSVDFDGSDDFLIITSNDDTSLKNNINTVSIWAYVRTVGPNEYSELYAVTGGTRTALQFRRIHMGFYLDNVFYSVPLSTNFNRWYHLVLEINRITNVAKVYSDGEYIGEVSFSAYTPTASSVRIGGNFLTGNSGDFFDGRIDNIMLFNRVLSQDEITALYYNQYKG